MPNEKVKYAALSDFRQEHEIAAVHGGNTVNKKLMMVATIGGIVYEVFRMERVPRTSTVLVTEWVLKGRYIDLDKAVNDYNELG